MVIITKRDRKLAFILVIYYLCKCIYWFNWNNGLGAYMDIFYHFSEKLYPTFLLLLFWDKISFKPIGYVGIALNIFLMVYSILCRYVDGFTDHKPIEIVGISFFYCVCILFITFIKRKQ